jgi:hypothetical protein
MISSSTRVFALLASAAALISATACGSDDDSSTPSETTGGRATSSTGGRATTGGASTGGKAATTGGAVTSDGGVAGADSGEWGGGDSGGDDAGAPGGAGGEPSGAGGEPGETGTPLYVVSHTISSGDQPTSFLTVVDSLEPGTEIDLKNSLELPGGARAYGLEGRNVVYTTTYEAPTLTEYSYDADAKPKKGKVVSFANLGISGTTGGNVHLFVSPTKAYFVSQETLEIVVWNPTEMEIIDTIPLDLELDAGYWVAFYPRPIVVGDELVLLANTESEDGLAGQTFVVVVDTADDTLVSTTPETRCHSLLQSGVDAEGDRYFAADGYAISTHLLVPDLAPGPCMLRMRAGETSLDAEWSRDFSEDLGTRLWTGVTQGKNKIFIESIPEDNPGVLAGLDAVDPYEISVADPWQWQALTNGDDEPTPVEVDFLTSPPLFPPIPVGDTAYASIWDDVDTTLIDLTTNDLPEKGLVVPGFVYNIVRIR